MDFGDMTFTICYHTRLLVLEEHTISIISLRMR
jgi:hypothetical protein